MNARLVGALLLPLVVLGRPALAQTREDVERAKASFQAGATAYAAGEYLAAIQALDAAYELTPVPAIAFSLAQAERRQYFVAHERSHLDRAITLFRKYVEQVTSGGRRADALDALSQLEPLAAQPIGGGGSRPAAAETARPARLMITADAPGARLTLDGGEAVASPLIREVQPGVHRLEASAEGFFPEQREVTAVAGELVPTAVVLRERLGAVALTTPADAEVYLDGSFVRRGGEGLALSLASGVHRLTVAQKGHRVSSRVLQIERGQSQDLHVTLEPTRQRKAATVLFLSGGAALGAGVVLGLLASRAENRAQDFLARRSSGNVSSADLSRYEQAVADRNHYRVAAAGSLGVMAGCLVTGLFLYHLDQADPEQLYRTSLSTERGRRPIGGPRSRLRFTPAAAPGTIAALVSATF
jgi:hypothetical protein